MRTALIVEDEYYVRAGIVRRVPWAQLGLRLVGEAADGAEALAFLRGRPVDILITDIRMPEMDGLEATAAIRAMERADSKTVPIIALTANAFDEDVKRSLQVSMNAHLSKPVDPEKLFETLETSISPDPKT